MLNLQKKIKHVNDKLIFPLNSEIQSKFSLFIEILFKWHEKKNLISTRDPEYFLKRDYSDSILLSHFLSRGLHLDVGTGAGIPGVILSIIRPSDKFILVDRRDYPMRFLEHVKLSLNLDNIELLKVDVKDICLDVSPNTVVFKNFSNKKISGLPMLKKMPYMFKLINSRLPRVKKVLVLTGSPALDLPEVLQYDNKSINCQTHELTSPFFSQNKYILEMSR